VVLSVVVITLSACADPSRAGDGDDGPTGVDAPTDVVLTCGVDGSTTLSSDVVRPQPDGVHLSVVNEHDEPVSVAGFDADPGRSTWVMTDGPGTKELMCWPFSQHESGDEPARTPLIIVDPDGLYVDGTLTCDGEQANMIGDYSEEPVDQTPTLDEAHGAIAGLLPDDEVLFAGYPEQGLRPIIVVRGGEVIGSFGLARWEVGPWEIVGYTVCADSGLPSPTGA
jgi:hypothetical protein